MPTYRQQRNVVVLLLHDQPTWGERRGEVYVCTFIQPQYVDWIGDTMAHLYYTVPYYTTLHYRIYLSIRFTRTGNPVCYLPTYLPLKCKYGMV